MPHRKRTGPDRVSGTVGAPGFRPVRSAAGLILTLILAACTAGPEYRRPEVAVPASFREGAPWKPVEPADHLLKGRWWEVFADGQLDELMERVAAANQDLKASLARVDQARAAVRVSGAGRYPEVDLDPSVERKRTADALASGGSGETSTTLRMPLNLAYEVDLWGRVRRSVQAAGSDYQASRADYGNLMLTLQAEAARNYFALRALDAEIDILGQTLELRGRNLDLVRSLFENGQVGRLDLARAETELANARADASALERLRASRQNTLAVLAGEPAPGFQISGRPLDPETPLPDVTPGLPSTLLERRPDIAAAERRLMADNARIGVAEAAFFPSISLTGSAGYSSDQLSSLFQWGNRTWALGPFVSLPILDGGRNRAARDLAEARWTESVANYRQAVLAAFAEVEGSLSDLRTLQTQARAQRQALASARRAADLTNKRYRAGLVSYLDVVISERTVLANELLAVRVLGQRLQATVTLIKALGGGWEEERPLGAAERGKKS